MLVSLPTADFLRYLTWVIFSLIGLWTVAQAVRRPSRVNIDIGLLFGGLTVAIVIAALVRAGAIEPNPLVARTTSTALIAMPYLLVRLMDDVIGVSRRLMRLFSALFMLSMAIVWVDALQQIALVPVFLLLSLLATLGYVVVAGVRATRRATGITRRRLLAVSVGTLLLACNFAAGSLPAVLPISEDDARSLVDVFGVLAGVSFFIGFTPPRWLRRVWQGPELRAFLAGTAALPQLPDFDTMLRRIEQGAAAALGAPGARIGLWDDGAQTMRFTIDGDPLDVALASDVPAARAFRLQHPVFSPTTVYDPALDARYRFGTTARAVLAAPITVSARRLGVLVVYGPRAPIFSDDDLVLLTLLADQIAVVLEGRRLNEEAALVRAREEAARLKEDFLSTAAHDLKTPLTTLVAQTQLMERRAARNPEAPVDQVGLRRLRAESERLRAMVLELLDAAQAERGQALEQRAPFDLAACIRDVARRHATERHSITVDAPDALVGRYDEQRLTQLVENLIENAVTYSPAGGAIAVRLWRDDAGDHLVVADQGIGIPNEDLPHLFERFHRGSNVDDRRFPGWGLGLSICRRIAEQHGGTIAVSSRLGAGSTFHVTLPRASIPQGQHATALPAE
jgi:signal transduction histidine kinase